MATGTFGNTDKEANAIAAGTGFMRGSKFQYTGPTGGSVQSITVYIKQYPGKTPNVKCAIYTDNVGSPLSKLTDTEEWTVTSGYDDWKTFTATTNPSLTHNAYYWLFIKESDTLYFYRGTGASNQYGYNTLSRSYASCYPSTFPACSKAALKVSIYCTYSFNTLSGVTRDSGGSSLGGCTVWLFKSSDKSYVDSTTSDGSGNYSFTVGAGIEHFIRIHKDGSPNVFGTSDDDLTGS